MLNWFRRRPSAETAVLQAILEELQIANGQQDDPGDEPLDASSRERWVRQIGELTLANRGLPEHRKFRLDALTIDPDVARHRHERNICQYWDVSPLLYNRLSKRRVAEAEAALAGESLGADAASKDYAALTTGGGTGGDIKDLLHGFSEALSVLNGPVASSRNP